MLGRLHRSRVVSALVLALFALGWLADRAHVAFERHAWCHEHQRVEHHDDAGPDGHGLGAHCASESETASCDADRPAFEPAEAAADDHAACCVVLARGGDPLAVLPDRSPAPLPPGVETRDDSHASTRAAAAQVPLVLLAPKQSPPAA